MKRMYILSSIFLIIIMVALFFNYYNEYKLESDERNDFNRASGIMMLSFNKENFYENLRIYESMEKGKKDTIEELIYDFSKHDMIPILGYLKQPFSNENLISSFNVLCNLLSDYSIIAVGDRENIFVRQKSGKYYTVENDIYTYYTKKKVITKKGFNDLYRDYLKTTKSNNINTLEKLSVDYEKNENEIIELIASDLEDFCNFVETNYFSVESYSLKKDIDSEEISINFKMKKHDRIYSNVSKYDNYNYTLDIDYLYEQINS